MTAVPDVVDEAVEEAMRQGCPVTTVPSGHAALEKAGSIGALLRYRE